MSVVSWFMDLLKATAADALLHRPVDVRVRRKQGGEVDVDFRMNPSDQRPQQNVYYYGPPQYGAPWYPPPPPGSRSERNEDDENERPQGPPRNGGFRMPRSFEG